MSDYVIHLFVMHSNHIKMKQLSVDTGVYLDNGAPLMKTDSQNDRRVHNH